MKHTHTGSRMVKKKGKRSQEMRDGKSECYEATPLLGRWRSRGKKQEEVRRETTNGKLRVAGVVTHVLRTHAHVQHTTVGLLEASVVRVLAVRRYDCALIYLGTYLRFSWSNPSRIPWRDW